MIKKTIVLYGVILIGFFSCQEENSEIPTLTTFTVENISSSMASSGGLIINDGGSPVTQRGVVWNTSPNPTTANNSTNNGNGPGSFTGNLTGLTANTTYYVRAYATNSAGTAYGNQQIFTTVNNGVIITNPGAGVTYNGHTYSSVVLGNGQEWMSENLKTENYRNGDPILTGLDDASWSSTTSGAYVIYNNDMANNVIYGKLYNWYAVADPRHVCPTGWHEPTDAEWTTLTDYLGGEDAAGGKMKTTGIQYWSTPNLDATNESGFSGLPGGAFNTPGTFNAAGSFGCWWSSSEYGNGGGSRGRQLNYTNGKAYQTGNSKKEGFSVRCLKD
jgi:uncharacterized protein (TIGR02145 family)